MLQYIRENERILIRNKLCILLCKAEAILSELKIKKILMHIYQTTTYDPSWNT